MDGANLTTGRYAQADPIVTITANGLLAISTSKVYRVTDGAQLGTLATSGAVQTASTDSTQLYVTTGSGIAVIDFTSF